MKLLMLTLSLLCICGAAATFGREFGAAYLARSPELSAFNALAYQTGIPEIPLSSRSMRALFATCGSVQQGVIYALQPPETRAAVDASCQRLAQRALVRNPTFSAAHTILMLSLRDRADISAALILSQMTGPRESWNAKLRLRKGLALFGSGQDAVDGALVSDLALLAQSHSGRVWLANLYRQNATSHSAIVGAIDRRPNDEKAAFLREVRRLAQN